LVRTLIDLLAIEQAIARLLAPADED